VTLLATLFALRPPATSTIGSAPNKRLPCGVKGAALQQDERPARELEAFIFPNKKGGFMDSNNNRNRVLQRLARELELPKPTFQVISAHDCDAGPKKGTIKDIQGVLRALPPGNDN
jgi:hypothetical protein